MQYYRRRPLENTPLPDPLTPLGIDMNNALGSDLGSSASTLRRLMPFPGAGGIAPASLLSGELPQALPTLVSSLPRGNIPGLNEQAAALVPHAASILDEEMARGVIAARDTPARTPSYGMPGSSESASPLLKQVHGFIDQIAQALPMLQQMYGVQGTAANVGTAENLGTRASANLDAIPTLTGTVVAASGQGIRLSMQLQNDEAVRVHLAPHATDLLSCEGARILSKSITFSTPEAVLAPGEKQDLDIDIAVAPNIGAGHYYGLLVIAGVEYLRAMICIQVTPQR
jgi:hypothetical protein